MTGFEVNGIRKQYGATNVYKAKKAFEYSCAMCGISGRQIKCESCAIANAHHDVINFVLR